MSVVTSLHIMYRSEAVLLQRAHTLRVAVKNHITTFDLATGYASASETARRQSGDCSEHAVLLAAVLRVDGIPSRVCSGLVYTERTVQVEPSSEACAKEDTECQEVETGRYTSRVRGSFAWHAWTQALIGQQWVDVDATLHNQPYSTGHVLMGTSSLSDRTGVRTLQSAFMCARSFLAHFLGVLLYLYSPPSRTVHVLLDRLVSSPLVPHLLVTRLRVHMRCAALPGLGGVRAGHADEMMLVALVGNLKMSVTSS